MKEGVLFLLVVFVVLVCGCVGKRESATAPTSTIVSVSSTLEETTSLATTSIALETTTVNQTATIWHADSCEDFCVKAGYVGGDCMRTASECRQKLENGVYKERGNKFCPKNTQYDYCCCILS